MYVPLHCYDFLVKENSFCEKNAIISLLHLKQFLSPPLIAITGAGAIAVHFRDNYI